MTAAGAAPQDGGPTLPRLLPDAAFAAIVLIMALLAAATLILVSRLPAPDDAIVLERAGFVPLPAVAAAAPDGAGADISLPHHCVPDPAHTGCAGLYRLSFHLPAEGARVLWGVYVPTFFSRLVVTVNGVLVADSRWFQSGAVIRQTEPLLAPVPAGLLRPGENLLELRVDSWDRFGAFLDRVYVGPDPSVRPAYAGRHFFLAELPRLLVAWQAALAVSLLVVWIGRRTEGMYLILTAILSLGVVNGLPLFATSGAVPDGLLRAANLTGLWQSALLPGLVTRLVGRPGVLPLRWALSVPAAVSVAFMVMYAVPLVPVARFGDVWILFGLPWTLGMLALAAAVAFKAARRPGQAEAKVIAGGFLVVTVLGLHDILLISGVLPDQRAFLTRFIPPFMMTLVSAALMWRFAKALNEVSRFNAVLRREVAAAEAALRASFAREQAQTQAAALESERLRLTRDLHDGLAGQLVSIVAQCELRGGGFRDVGAAARRALDDLRLVVASLDDVGNDLAMMLAQFRERIEPQVRAQGIELDWQMAPLPEVGGLRSEHALALFRILQEAVSNAARHSGSTRITIAMTPAADDDPDHAVRIVVADGGRGGAADRTGGRGLANMRRRAVALGAEFALASGPDGTRIAIDLPRAFPDPPAGRTGP